MKKLIMCIPVILIALSFQNCSLMSGDATLTSSYKDPNAEFFKYPYTAKPEFYSHYQLMRLEKDSTTMLRKWRFYGAISAGDPGTAIVYNLKLMSKTGQLLCPTQDATLATGTGTVDFECSTSLDPLETKLVWRITINGQDVELIREQTYAAD